MQQRLGFLKGMQTDLSPQKMSPDNYLDALNVSLSSDNTGTIGSITNAKGTNLLFKLPEVVGDIFQLKVVKAFAGNIKFTFTSLSNFSINMWSNPVSNSEELYNALISNTSYQSNWSTEIEFRLVEDTVLVVCTSTTRTLASVVPSSTNIESKRLLSRSSIKLCGWGSFQNDILLLTKGRGSTTGHIWKLQYNPETDSISNVASSTKLLNITDHLIYGWNNANFPDDEPIQEIIFRYKNESNIKMYWVDGVNLLRHINIQDPYLFSLSPTALDSMSDVNLSEISTIEEEVGGFYTAGRIQYCYQLFNLDGSESLISPASRLYSIIPPFSGLTSGDSVGVIPETNCNKSFRVTINNIDNRFELIRLIAIHYTQPNSDPSIRVVHESNVNSSNITILDTGAVSLEEYSLSEFRVLNNRFIIPKTLTSKDNRLILGNVTEDYFDVDEYVDGYWDSRAYRYINNTPTFVVDNITYTDFEDVPKEADCIWDGNVSRVFQKDNEVLGGTGLNISYKFITKNVEIDLRNEATIDRESIFTEPPNTPNKGYEYTTYNRLETYRFGIVFVDTKGRTSFTKWIADIKFPDYHEFGTSMVLSGGSKILSKNIGIEFTVNNVPTGLQYFIVRVPRESNDKSVLAQGVLGTVYDVGKPEDVYLKCIPTNTISADRVRFYKNTLRKIPGKGDEKVFLFKSPEISFNFPIEILSNIKVRYNLMGNLRPRRYPNGNTIGGNTYRMGYEKTTQVLTRASYGLSSPVERDLIDFKTVDGSPDKEYRFQLTDNNSKTQEGSFINYTEGYSNEWPSINWSSFGYTVPGGNTYTRGHNKCTSLLLSLSEGFTDITGDSIKDVLDSLMIVTLIIDRSGKQYGGNLFVNRSLNNYIKCGTVQQYHTGSKSHEVFGGDVFIRYFSFLNSAVWNIPGANQATAETVHIPLETSVDLYNRHDIHPNMGIYRTIPLVQETVALGKEIFGDDYPDYLTDLYQYNETYSREADAQIYFPKPFYADFNKDFLNRVMISNKHLGVELSDPWLKYPFDQYTDVDSVYGQVTKLLNFKDNIVFFQNKAFGVIPINEKRLLSPQSQEESPLTLGTGDLISDYKYLSERSGCQNVYSAIKTDKGIYWLDMINRKFNVWSGEGVQALSDALGVSTLFNNFYYDSVENIGKLLENKGAHLVHNSKNNKILITMLAPPGVSTGANTIAFNELLGVFESRHTMLPKMLLDLGNVTIGADFNPDISEPYITMGHSLFKGSPGDVFNKTGKTASFITLIANDNALFRKVFTNLEFNSNVYDTPSKTISRVRVFNNNQDSDSIVLIPGNNIIRRGTTWRMAVPRDSSAQQDRMRDYYLKIRIDYNNTDGDTIVLDDIIVHYMIPAL